jgi:SpoVK/Ycf46/Vps4 family AAA+-type ATPase
VQQGYTVSYRQKYSILFIDELDNIIKTKDDNLKGLNSTLIST